MLSFHSPRSPSALRQRGAGSGAQRLPEGAAALSPGEGRLRPQSPHVQARGLGPLPHSRPPPRRGAAGRRPLCAALACSDCGSDGGRRSPAASGDIFSGSGAAVETSAPPGRPYPSRCPPGRRPGGALSAWVSAGRAAGFGRCRRRYPVSRPGVAPEGLRALCPGGDLGEKSTTFGGGGLGLHALPLLCVASFSLVVWERVFFGEKLWCHCLPSLSWLMRCSGCSCGFE